ncbi:TetR/AcrR family transcriptional regulator [Bacillus sp. 165]|uniref:TetR/AcrR family transcriptional regulator n=1 Tax=Bacillus sp. 165 TaxID=1529117 RepID=UPI001AD98DD4|nr:TetR/AcrR family transcriptional regulator [Bacillus sp. 165]MBO9131216.1 TetR/AcrR family transcriptional regulator [Bacillus sp. 165]
MNERKKIIIETAMKLFGQKGYHSTSIQEIAEKSGISKGSVYNYFTSKEDLMLSIFKYYYESISSKMLNIEQNETVSSKEALVKQITLQFTEFSAHREFIHMNMGEKSILIHEELRNFIFKMRAESLNWYCKRLVEVYGEAVSPFVLDCATMLNGIIGEYFLYIVVDQEELDFAYLASFIVRRLDGIVQSLAIEKQPVLRKEMLSPYLNLGDEEKKVFRAITEMKEKLADISYDQKKIKQVCSSLEELENELKEKEEPREYIVEGLLLYIKNQEIQEIQGDIELLESSIKRQL